MLNKCSLFSLTLLCCSFNPSGWNHKPLTRKEEYLAFSSYNTSRYFVAVSFKSILLRIHLYFQDIIEDTASGDSLGTQRFLLCTSLFVCALLQLLEFTVLDFVTYFNVFGRRSIKCYFPEMLITVEVKKYQVRDE